MQQPKGRFTTFLALVLAAAPAGAVTTLLELRGDVGSSDDLGHAVARVGDLSGDGVDEIVAGSPHFDGFDGTGYVQVFSGADGAVLHTVLGLTANEEFGWSVAGVGDVDGDGVADFAVGAPEADVEGFGSGSVSVFSGADGAELYAFHGLDVDHNLGLSVAGAGDVDGDGFPDVVAGATVDIYPIEAPDYARVYSGRDGTVLHHFENAGADDKLGFSVAGLGDVDGDGYADVAAGAPFASFGGLTFAGRVHVFSGRRGRELYRFEGEEGYGFVGYTVAGFGDVDGDGVPDLGAGAWGIDPHGAVTVWSGADGAELYAFHGDEDAPLGTGLGAAGDVDGDGHAELFLGTVGTVAGVGGASVLSGRDAARLHGFYDDPNVETFTGALGTPGDLDGDGRPEVMFGGEDGGARGVVYVVALEDAAFWGDLGEGLAGGSGAPELVASGTPAAGEPVTFSISGARPDSAAVVVVGRDAAYAPLRGGTLVPSPELRRDGLRTDADGSLELTLAWPASVPSEGTVYVQAWIADPTGPEGATATNALRAWVP